MRSFKLIYSINFDKIRRSPKDIIYIIFHYTGMISEKKAIVRLINKNSKVSSHYFIKRDGTIIRFLVTDFIKEVPVTFEGVPPDLFKEDSGVVILGYFLDGTFEAEEIFAKHDENYMPPELAIDEAKV